MSSILTDQLVGGPTGLNLRKFVEQVESAGELKKISGANWDLETGATKPFHWIKEFAPTSTITEQDFEETMRKWGSILSTSK